MALKVYGIEGRTTALLRITTRSGKSWIEVEFKRGKLGLGASNQAATYCTKDKTEQDIIEDSPMFGGLIKLMRVYNANKESAAPEQAAPAEKAPKEFISIPEITSREEAISYLKGRGAKAIHLKDDDSIRKFMDKLGVEFPNFTI